MQIPLQQLYGLRPLRGIRGLRGLAENGTPPATLTNLTETYRAWNFATASVSNTAELLNLNNRVPSGYISSSIIPANHPAKAIAGDWVQIHTSNGVPHIRVMGLNGVAYWALTPATSITNPPSTGADDCCNNCRKEQVEQRWYISTVQTAGSVPVNVLRKRKTCESTETGNAKLACAEELEQLRKRLNL